MSWDKSTNVPNGLVNTGGEREKHDAKRLEDKISQKPTPPKSTRGERETGRNAPGRKFLSECLFFFAHSWPSEEVFCAVCFVYCLLIISIFD